MNLRRSLVCAAIAFALGACARNDAAADIGATTPTAPTSSDTTVSTELSATRSPATIGPGERMLAPGNNLVRADTDHDGLISRAEADADVDLRGRFTTLDTNGDDALSSDEWLAAPPPGDTPR